MAEREQGACNRPEKRTKVRTCVLHDLSGSCQVQPSLVSLHSEYVFVLSQTD